ncbi:hypothetical protein CYMTET_22278 [Cymbomonas tetramitiformis]|uniref:Uncharacterized protein n=1 Tax=Cymbomonas tetramitiformis TaxID=36881 RepID=A0AAE0G0K0_9CHLO|nr:hypothetical protein CYMTET_22278 [Cymbomonas tetramitiformis]
MADLWDLFGEPVSEPKCYREHALSEVPRASQHPFFTEVSIWQEEPTGLEDCYAQMMKDAKERGLNTASALRIDGHALAAAAMTDAIEGFVGADWERCEMKSQVCTEECMLQMNQTGGWQGNAWPVAFLFSRAFAAFALLQLAPEEVKVRASHFCARISELLDAHLSSDPREEWADRLFRAAAQVLEHAVLIRAKELWVGALLLLIEHRGGRAVRRSQQPGAAPLGGADDTEEGRGDARSEAYAVPAALPAGVTPRPNPATAVPHTCSAELSVVDFANRFHRKGLPVVITGEPQAASWRALDMFQNLHWLAAPPYAERLVPIELQKGAGEKISERMMTIRHFVEEYLVHKAPSTQGDVAATLPEISKMSMKEAAPREEVADESAGGMLPTLATEETTWCVLPTASAGLCQRGHATLQECDARLTRCSPAHGIRGRTAMP